MTETTEPAGDAAAALQSPGTFPIAQNRFLFVDVAALRAKQLRRGALPRLPSLAEPSPIGYRADHPTKLERIAMEEVRQGIISYELPKGTTPGGAAVSAHAVEEDE